MKIISLDEIKTAMNSINVISEIEKGFVAYSQGNAVVPPVGELLFDKPPGDVHIKYGYLRKDDFYVIKIASCFYKNPTLHLPSSNGLMLLFSKKTGELLAILLDEGYLTNVRTAAAGAIAAKYLAPKNIHAIGIVGTGIQARLQLLYLKQVTSCREVVVWGRNKNNLKAYENAMNHEGFSITTTTNMSNLTAKCNVIVTTTSTTKPLIKSNDIEPGTHITAVGSDTPEKQELETMLLNKADILVTDSLSQCVDRGEISHALKEEKIKLKNVLELGHIIAGTAPSRQSDNQITIADLTGVAVQDIQVAKAVYWVKNKT